MSISTNMFVSFSGGLFTCDGAFHFVDKHLYYNMAPWILQHQCNQTFLVDCGDDLTISMDMASLWKWCWQAQEDCVTFTRKRNPTDLDFQLLEEGMQGVFYFFKFCPEANYTVWVHWWCCHMYEMAKVHGNLYIMCGKGFEGMNRKFRRAFRAAWGNGALGLRNALRYFVLEFAIQARGIEIDTLWEWLDEE